ncbi:hypothetical protein Tco_0973845 [Tanacetum coccineum]|uniref:Uncharacterized protein n=1 Tax=Tanacetum coccineum TaxID=301880 RepID=A0ABQ5E9V7_9ASTR
MAMTKTILRGTVPEGPKRVLLENALTKNFTKNQVHQCTLWEGASDMVEFPTEWIRSTNHKKKQSNIEQAADTSNKRSSKKKQRFKAKAQKSQVLESNQSK